VREVNENSDERDLGVFVDGGDEIGEEIEAKKWLR